MSLKTVPSLFLLGMLCAAGCGGGGGGTPPPPTITSVSASCSPNSVEANTTQTSQCAATVMGTGSYSSAVTWSANYGTITGAGVYTPPATPPASGAATVTATSTEDATKSGPTSVTITPAPTITSVSVSCTQTTLQAHTAETSQCSATVKGTGSFSSTVTWSATYGTITDAGVYTPPATAPASGMDTVTATSTEDGTKSGQEGIAITAARSVTLTPQYPAISQAEIPSSTLTVQIGATNIQADDVIDWTEMGVTKPYTVTAADVTAGYFTVTIQIYEIASFVQFNCPASTSAVCNTAWIAITTDQQQLVENTSSPSTTAYFNPGVGFGIQEFSLSSGANVGALPMYGPLVTVNRAITVDGGANGTGTVLSDIDLQQVDSNAGNSSSGFILPNGSFPNDELASIAAWNGYGYVTEPNGGNQGYLGQFKISTANGLGVPSTVTAGDFPYAIDAATVNSTDAIVVYSGVDRQVRLFGNTPALTQESTSAALSNITAFPIGNQSLPGSQGGWPLRIIGSGSEAGTVGILSSYDHVLDLLTISGTTVSWAGATNGAVTIPSGNPYPYLIAPDPTHGAFIVASADTTKGVTTLQSISATSPYTATPIPSSALTAGFLASGILVSDNGSEIYVAGFNTLTPGNPVSATNTPLFFTIANP
ncbi:MAG: hypothetical protein ABSD72_06755 [Terracidiphilus sp.]